ncbi:MAG: hypothetical protein J6Z26_01620, partial [Bacteroidales bacterium]|nr:hypothetical protein [Bacteroidales bacterium]
SSVFSQEANIPITRIAIPNKSIFFILFCILLIEQFGFRLQNYEKYLNFIEKYPLFVKKTPFEVSIQ